MHNLPKFTTLKNNFKKNVLVTNSLVKILIDTGAKMYVCGEQPAKLWGIYDKMKPPFAKIHPYNSAPIKVTWYCIRFCKFQKSSCARSFIFYQDHATQF